MVVSQDADAGTARVWLTLAADDAASASQTAIAVLRSLPTPQSLVPTAIHVDAAMAHAA